MTNQQRPTVVGVFQDHFQADRAVTELRRAGFREDQIGVAGRHVEGAGDTGVAAAEEGSAVETGAITGALAGAGLGGLVGLGILAGVIPAIGPVIAGGTLAALLANAAGGAALGTLAGALVGAGIPEEEAKYYHKEFEQGRIIVTVKADGRADEATAILRKHGAYDMHSSGSSVAGATGTLAGGAAGTRAGGVTGSHVGTSAGAHVGSAPRAEGGQNIKVREEELHAHKHPVEAGEVKVRKEVTTEHKSLEVPVRREEVVIERHPATGQQASAADIRGGEEVRIPVMEEEVDVEKRAVVKEEVNVGKRVVQDTERVGGEVRKEQVRVEREGDVDVRGTGNERSKP
jgi:uncharacterized protein (TIGR02271 family)